MRILVGIASYGVKNQRFLERVLAEYRGFTHFKVDLVVFTEAERNFGSDVQVVAGLPIRNPWSLPFAHKGYFADRVECYDLFIYSEDDTLITEANIESFLRVTKLLPKDQIAGFIRYETSPDGARVYTTMHAHHHWDCNSVMRLGEHAFARYSNEHSACYILTQEQLRRAIASGGYTLPAREGRYDMLVTAATDPYTQCGMKKVICISHFDEFCLHHLPNVYWHYMGLPEAHVQREIQELLNEESASTVNGPLFRPDTLLADVTLDKQYYEGCREDIVRAVPHAVKTLLSIGCGSGTTEAHLVARGVNVTAIPMDRIVGRTAASKGIRVLPPSIENALDLLNGERFECILLNDVLCHLPEPEELLQKIGAILKENGRVIVSSPNGGGLRSIKHRRILALRRIFADQVEQYHDIRYHLAGLSLVRRWFGAAGMKIERLECEVPEWWQRTSRVTRGLLDHLVARRFLFICSSLGG